RRERIDHEDMVEDCDADEQDPVHSPDCHGSRVGFGIGLATGRRPARISDYHLLYLLQDMTLCRHSARARRLGLRDTAGRAAGGRR
ncbi:MAG: hypothetical protein WAT70_10000, partial [Rhizobiaceae bacterium]